MSDAPIDFESLLARCMGEADFLREMLGLFRDQAVQHFATLDERFNAGDVEGIRKIAHAIKGSSANLSATTLSALAAEVEQTAKSGQLPSAAKVAELKVEFERVVAYFPTIESRL